MSEFKFRNLRSEIARKVKLVLRAFICEKITPPVLAEIQLQAVHAYRSSFHDVSISGSFRDNVFVDSDKSTIFIRHSQMIEDALIKYDQMCQPQEEYNDDVSEELKKFWEEDLTDAGREWYTERLNKPFEEKYPHPGDYSKDLFWEDRWDYGRRRK